MVDFENDLKNCVQTLLSGGVILYPTDTVWGLGCDAMNEAAVEKIFNLKQRPKDKSMIVLLADARDVLQIVASPPPDIIAIIENFERPTTVVYENALGFPENVVNRDGSLAIRVTTDPFCKALIKRFRGPIISTSANISGTATPKIFSEIATEVVNGADYVVKFRQDDHVSRQPSRLIRLNDDGDIEVLRG